MTLVRWLCCSVAVAFFAGCSVTEETQDLTPSAPAPGEVTPEESPEPDPSAQGAPAPERSAPSKQVAGDASGENHCDLAYGELMEMIQALQKQLGGGSGGGQAMPREDFVRGCQELPEVMQRCMRVSYSMDHAEQCQQAQAALSPEQSQRASALMGRNR